MPLVINGHLADGDSRQVMLIGLTIKELKDLLRGKKAVNSTTTYYGPPVEVVVISGKDDEHLKNQVAPLMAKASWQRVQ